uniref:BAR domain-containing protein n=1 Tax=Globodera pallida TaxID=36090 RepID=A0A183BSJ8_GLOPA
MEHYNAIVELINDLSAKEKPNYYEENEQLQKDTETVIKEIRRLDNQIMVYRRASSALNAACELHMDSNQLELYEPQYSNAFIQFIAEGAEYCSALKMGKSVDYPEQRQYNFFEELIEEIADTENAAKVVKKMQFSLNKTEQKKDYDAVLGPRGVLRHSGVLMREGKIGIEGRIEIGGEQKTTKKSLLKTQKLREQFYKVSNQKTKAAFEVRLVFSEPRKQQPLSEHKLLALHINAMASE